MQAKVDFGLYWLLAFHILHFKSNWSQLHFAIMKAFHISCFLWRTYKMQFVVYEGFSSKPVYFRALIKWLQNCYTTSLAWTILKIATSLSAYNHFNFPKQNSCLYHDSWLMWEKLLRRRQLRNIEGHIALLGNIAEIRVYSEVFPFGCLRCFADNVLLN